MNENDTALQVFLGAYTDELEKLASKVPRGVSRATQEIVDEMRRNAAAAIEGSKKRLDSIEAATAALQKTEVGKASFRRELQKDWGAHMQKYLRDAVPNARQQLERGSQEAFDAALRSDERRWLIGDVVAPLLVGGATLAAGGAGLAGVAGIGGVGLLYRRRLQQQRARAARALGTGEPNAHQ